MTRAKDMVLCCLLIGLFMPLIGRAALHDPTKPVVDVNAFFSDESGGPNLQSVIISPQRKLALIDGQWVGVGSDFNGARILAIGKNHVVLLYGGQKRTLYLFGKRLWTHR
jgi:MSHA biogenesis protein MshK